MIDEERTRALAESASSDAESSLEAVRGLRVPLDLPPGPAVELIREAKERAAELRELRDGIVRPLREAIARVDDLFRPALSALDEIEATLKAEILRARAAGEERARDLLTRAADSDDPERLIRAADAARVRLEDVVGIQVRRTWAGEVTDADAIPREYLAPDVKALTAATRKAKGDPGIPGWRAELREVVAISGAGK